MSLADYLISVLGLAAVLLPLGFAAARLRSRLLPGWEGAPARLAEAVLAVSLLTVTLQLLGAFGVLHPATLVIATVTIGVAAAVWFPPGPSEATDPPPSKPVSRLHLALALAAAAFLAIHWATGLQDVFARGITTFDSLWYHGPFSARIADSGNAWPLHFTDPLYLNWFYPENSELQHSAGMVLFGNDFLSPFLNFAWLGLALLAAWCIGRPYGVAPLCLVAVAVILDTGPMVPREAGSMANDIAPIALLLTVAALLLNATATSRKASGRASGGGARGVAGGPAEAISDSDGSPAATPPTPEILLIAGLTAGLALGTKMTIAGAVAALAVGVIFLMPPQTRARAFGIFVGGVAITAGFWFLRNLIHTGNPLPWINQIGPIDLPGPDRGLEGRDPFSVSHYIFENPSGNVWNSYFLDGVTNLLGPGWFLMAAGAAAGALLALFRPRTMTVRVLGAVAVVAAVAYLFTPLTAAGPDGRPTAFTINFRYALAAFALALALLPLWRPIAAERFRIPRSGRELSGDGLRTALLLGGLLTLVVTSRNSDSAASWDAAAAYVPTAVLIGLVLIGVPVGLALLGRRSRLAALAAGAALAVILVAVGYARQDDYLDSRYAGGEGFQFQLDDAVAWANPTDDLRIGVAGTSGAYNQYGLYGTDLSNYVQYVGARGPGGDFRAIEKCAAWRQAVNDGDYDYLVTSPALDLNAPEDTGPTPERGWLLGADNAKQLIHTGRVSVFALTGPLDPAGCSKAHRNPDTGKRWGAGGKASAAPAGGQ